MSNIQKVILFVLLTCTWVACQKDTVTPTVSVVQHATEGATAHADNHTHPKKSCSSTAYTEKLNQRSQWREQRQQMEQQFAHLISHPRAQSRTVCTNPTLMPVAIHYQGMRNPDRSCLVTAAQEAIAILNADFRATNADIALWDNQAAARYPGVNKGVTCVEFRLGTRNHPNGFGLSDGDVAVTINQTNGDFSSDWSGYINIFVGDADGALGYAPLGGAGTGDGMVISSEAFATTTNCGNLQSHAPLNLGRTLTHEMGHYLNLDHVWGEGGCRQDDLVDDTPNQADPTYGCPSLGSVSACSGQALFMNYMDYVDDGCMYMFTAGQAARAEAWMNSGLLNNLKSGSDVFGDDPNGGNDNPPTNGGGDDDGNDDEPTDGGDDEGDINEEAGETALRIRLKLDDYGSETTMVVEDEDGESVAIFGPYEDGEAETVINEYVSVPDGAYTFVIYDDYGDGICCRYGRGKWRLLADGELLAKSNGRFGYWEAVDFFVGNARQQAPELRKDEADEVELAQKQRVQPKVAKTAAVGTTE